MTTPKAETPEMPRINARWTNDCQGKKDFDGPIIDISTRYWPRGGGFAMLSPEAGFQQSGDVFTGIKPSATSHIRVLHAAEDEGDIDTLINLASADFEADTEAEVKAQVEAWAAEQYVRIVRVLCAEFGTPPEPSDVR